MSESARFNMIEAQIRTNNVTDVRIHAALDAVMRERFVPAAKQALAYADVPVEIAPGRYLLDPRSFAKALQLVQLTAEDKVLDVGCGTGYSSAVLARLAADVVAVEDDPALVAQAREALRRLGVGNVTIAAGDLATVGKSKAPYDVIVLEGVVPAVDEALFAQLKPEGRLVALVGAAGEVPVAHLFAKSGKGIAARRDFDARLPPLQKVEDDSFVF